MKTSLKIIFGFIFIFLLTIFPSHHLSHAVSQKQSTLRPAITVINLIRGNGLGHEKDNLFESLKAQVQVTKDENVRATWLLQYGALEDKNIVNFAKNNMSGQDLGLLFEIDRNYAEKAGVQFRGQGTWYFSDGLLLISYDINERKKLIDAAFSKFKNTFGYYPKTVGAWWIGADSLLYMQKRYAIIAALRASDQFNLDFYSIWGTPWSIPYVASKENEGVPAKSLNESSKVVILQWAARDPLSGYKDPLFSMQDYTIKGYDLNYVDYLSSIYLKNQYDNIVIGLENGGNLKTFSGFYLRMLQNAKKMEKENKASVILAKDYARNFLSQKKVFPNTNYFISNGYNSSDQSFWYMSENYRAAVHKIKNEIYFVDVHNFANKINEDFALLSNSQPHLRVNEPEVIDSMRFPDGKILIAKSSDILKIKEQNGEIDLYSGKKKIAQFSESNLKITADKKINFNFTAQRKSINLVNLLFVVYFFYFAGVFYYKRRFRKTLIEAGLFLIIFFFGYAFLNTSQAFIFDKKELFLFYLFPFSLFTIQTKLAAIKVLPFLLLFLLHFIYLIKLSKNLFKYLYYAGLVLVFALYFHFPYFPLDKSTYKFLAILIFILVFVLFSTLLWLLRQKKSKRFYVYYFACTLSLLALFFVSVVFSRSRLVFTPFEFNALKVVQRQNKDILYVTQAIYEVNPIYKAVKPLLYNNFWINSKLTGKDWKIVVRPKDNVLKISDYNNKLIVVPRYLGSDLSDYEEASLKLKKIFDNSQIAIYEKGK